jgi:TPR repeat protein
MRDNIVKVSVGLRRALFCAAAASLMTLAGAGGASANYEAGLEAYKKGEYPLAIDIWKRFAVAGDVRSKKMLGEVYSDNICGQKTANLETLGYRPSSRLKPEALPTKVVDLDYVQALKWYTLAAYHDFGQYGYPTPEEVNSKIIAEGCLPYVREEMKTADVRKAEDLAAKTFEAGSNYDLYNLGLMYQRGAGVEKNNVKALMLFDLAKARGVGEASAAFERVERLMDATEIKTARELAVAWQPPLPPEHLGSTAQMAQLEKLKKELEELRKEDALEAVSDIDVELIQLALKSLGFYLGTVDNTMGPGTRAAIKKFQYSRVAKDTVMTEEDKEAVKTGVLSASQTVDLIGEAAKNEHPKSQYVYGIMHARGIGVVQDGAKAIEWLKKSAAADNALAHYALGVLYRDGSTGLNEVTPNKTLAARHFARALALGYAPARKALELLEFEAAPPQE